MNHQGRSSTTAPRRSLYYSVAAALVFLIAIAPAAAVYGQETDERSRAFQLYKDAKYTEALPLFEKLAVAHPNDKDVIETLGLLILGQAAYTKDPVARKAARKRGREVLVRAQQLGANSNLLHQMLDAIPEDGGGETGFSSRKEIDDAMREGEAAFASGNYQKALEFYQQALSLDPQLYEAALFSGDVFFKTNDPRKAGEWYARAIGIAPDRETAYRYWGDSLMSEGRVVDARDKFMEAYLAEPYSRLSRAALLNWGQKTNVQLGHPNVAIPESGAFKEDDKSASAMAWKMYMTTRASWPTSEFAKQYPGEQKYRHSLKEEAAAFRAALKLLRDQKQTASTDLDPSLQAVLKLENDGLLEPFILLALADAGIAKDFPDYRKSNIASLRRYFSQYILTGGRQ